MDRIGTTFEGYLSNELKMAHRKSESQNFIDFFEAHQETEADDFWLVGQSTKAINTVQARSSYEKIVKRGSLADRVKRGPKAGTILVKPFSDINRILFNEFKRTTKFITAVIELNGPKLQEFNQDDFDYTTNDDVRFAYNAASQTYNFAVRDDAIEVQLLEEGRYRLTHFNNEKPNAVKVVYEASQNGHGPAMLKLVKEDQNYQDPIEISEG